MGDAAVLAGPLIRRATKVHGRTLVLRDASPEDAAFILALRTQARKSRFLSAVSGSMTDQQAWLRRYQARDGEAYFVIESLAGAALGTVRLYDARGSSFCWGSWILDDSAPPTAAIESALMVYAYAVDTLGFRAAHFQVQRGNERVRRFHERFGAVLVDACDKEYRYRLGIDAILASRVRYARFLPDGVTVEGLQ